jgi:hypothetical protein
LPCISLPQDLSCCICLAHRDLLDVTVTIVGALSKRLSSCCSFKSLSKILLASCALCFHARHTDSHIQLFGMYIKSCVKSCIFWEITPCSPLKVNRRFGGICRRHLQGRSMSQARNRHGTGACRLIFNGLHGVISRSIHIPHCENFKSYEMIRFRTIIKHVQNSFNE